MKYDTQDFTARRFSPSFDCELPEEARSELRRPKRPVILGRPVYQPTQRPGIFKWVIGFALCAIILAGMLANYSVQRNIQATPKAVPKESTPVIQPTPMPAKPAVQPPAEQTRLVIAPAPRAALVRLPLSPPRAQLARLPWSQTELVELTAAHIDETHVITMPYGTQVRATLRGFLENENQLPRGGRIGDMYVVGTVPWIWIRVPGTTAPTWVDP